MNPLLLLFSDFVAALLTYNERSVFQNHVLCMTDNNATLFNADAILMQIAIDRHGFRWVDVLKNVSADFCEWFLIHGFSLSDEL